MKLMKALSMLNLFLMKYSKKKHDKARGISFCFFLCLFFLGSSQLYAQQGIDNIKNDAINQMRQQRFGEAIDLLNKFISARPRIVDGYLLRGECYEKRGQFEYAVLDYRNALKVAPNDGRVSNNLSRAEAIWYAQLRKKIEGHQREIAINPSIPINYLEIGKCHKHMGEWVLAEQWYDEYIKRQEPSADEVIRYTEILARNNHIEKGEKILKKFVEKYPNDHRLWSRYGYFQLWLGKKKPAAEDFRTALKLRPYFKEAEDGLEQAEDRAYIYTYYDTTKNHKKLLEGQKKPQEYAIDKYYKLLKKNPEDVDTRYLLVKELINTERLEEAYEQLQIIGTGTVDSTKFVPLWDTVNARRDKQIEANSAASLAAYEKDPTNKEIVKKVAQAYARQLNYEDASQVLKKFLEGKAETDHHDLRYILAQYSAWNYQFEAAIEQLNYLLAKEPNNLDYQLLRAQVAVWTTTDPELANQYLDNVLAANPKNLAALVGKSTLLIRDRKFPEGLAKIEEARKIDPTNKAVENAQNFYDVRLALEEDVKNFEILSDARKIAESGDCKASQAKYEEYFSKIKQPSKIEMMEYADVVGCAGDWNKSKGLYQNLLAQEYDYDVSLQLAKATMWSGDSTGALPMFEKLVKEDTTNYDARLFMAEDLEKMEQRDRAKDILDTLLITTVDTTKREIVRKRLGWLLAGAPRGGNFWSGLSHFPSYVRLVPSGFHYSDNQNLRVTSGGLLMELGLFQYLGIGASIKRTYLKGTSNSSNLYYTQYYAGLPGDYTVSSSMTAFKWHVFLYPTQNLYATAGFGTLSYQGVARRNVMDATVRWEKKNKALMMLSYEKSDAMSFVYSARLVYNNLAGTRYNADNYLFNYEYHFSPILKVSGHFQYLSLSDGNQGNDIIVKLGRKFAEGVTGGYEYDMTNYSRSSAYYYAPQHFEAHSLWGEYEYPYDEDLTFTIGGKLGYVPSSDFIIKELNGRLLYKPIDSFVLSLTAALGESSRDDTSYKYVSAYFSVYYTIF
jgi:Flp pilus assembly protein TadD